MDIEKIYKRFLINIKVWKEKLTIENIAHIVQVIFCIFIGCTTIYSLNLTLKYNRLILTPAVGVNDLIINCTLTDTDKGNVYDNVKELKITFNIKNSGTLPAKNLRVTVSGFIGDERLPIENNADSSVNFVLPGAESKKYVIISKDLLNRVAYKKERLIYKVEVKYTDLENYQKYSDVQYYELRLINMNPFEVHFAYRDDLGIKEANKCNN